METRSKARRYDQLMASRRGKKGSITTRIQVITRIICESGSRSQLQFLMDALLDVRTALQKVCDELYTLSDDVDSEWMDEENLRVDMCVSDVKAYLDRRKDDPPSAGSLTDSWVEKHAAVKDVVTIPDEPLDDEGLFGGMLGAGLEQTSSNPAVSQFLRPPHQAWSVWSEQFPTLMTTMPVGASSSLQLTRPYHQNYTNTSGFTSQPLLPRFPPPAASYSPAFNYSATSAQPGAIPRIVPPATLPAPSYAPSAAPRSVGAPSGAGFAAPPGVPSSAGYMQHPPQQQPPQQLPQQPRYNVNVNAVDSWIDTLDGNGVPPAGNQGMDNDIAMAFFIQNSLPRMTIPVFNGSPLVWVESWTSRV